MNRQLDKSRSEDQAQGESANQMTRNRSLPSQPRYQLVAWILLLLLGALFLFGSISDLLAELTHKDLAPLAPLAPSPV